MKMVCRFYLGFHVALLHARINALSVAAAVAHFETYCDSTIYGLPNYSACSNLLLGNSASRSHGIKHIDSVEHGFLLPYFGTTGDFTAWQWRNRVELPEVWASGMFGIFLHFLRAQDRLRLRAGSCKVALFVNSNPSGGFYTDSGRWSDIALKGKYVADSCKVGLAVAGGAGSTGNEKNNALAVGQ